MNPSEEDKLAIGSLAVEEWYKEYQNYSRQTSDWNGNILHNEQISHFLQVVWDGSKGDNEIGVGISSNDKHTIIVVQYDNKRDASEENEDKVRFQNFWESESFLTIQEEENLTNFIKKRKTKYDEVYEKFEEDEDNDAEDVRIKLERNCKFYVKKAALKLQFLHDEAKDPFMSKHNLGTDFSIDDWKEKLEDLQTTVDEAEELLDEDLDHDNICDIYEKVLKIKIPNSLAEERFENLQLVAFFKGTLDLLNLSSTVGGSTPSNSRLASHTLANCLTATTITPDTSLATNTTTMSNNQYKKIVKVFVGYFSVITTGNNTTRDYDDDDFANWKECCKRIKARWDANGAKNVCVGYNALRQNGDQMDASWPGTAACVADTDYSSKTISEIFS